ncbi:bifunctional DNA primase/polymerase [Micromonosporaceae bacterium B7E4]
MNNLTDQELDEALNEALRREDMDEFNRLGDEADRRATIREARLVAPGALRVAAEWYIGQGIAVFPLQPGGKVPATKHGFKDASTDLEQVRRWWAATPAANIGLPTGGLFDVIDVDGEQGARSHIHLTGTDLLPPIFGYATTGRPCSRHLYIQATGDGNAAGLWPGIDYRGKGGYVVAPPSRTGRRYDWLHPLDVAGLKAGQ